jgi:hypothetical protein
MSSKHLSAETVEHYRERMMPPAELLAADDHLATCEACRGRVAEGERVADMFAALRSNMSSSASSLPEHLTYEQLAAYVDESLNETERALADKHLQLCALCDAEMRDLEGFKATILPQVAAQREARSISQLSGKRSQIGWREAIFGWVAAPRWAGAMAIAAILLLAALAGIIWFAQRSPHSQQTEVAKISATPSPTATPAPEITPSPALSESPDNTNVLPTPSYSPAPAAPQIMLALNDGGRLITIDKEGNLSGLEMLPTSSRQALKTTLRTGRLETPSDLGSLNGKTGTLLGTSPDGDSFSLRGPQGEIVRDTRPTLRWQPLEKATSYVVSIYDAGFNKVASSPALSGSTWRPPQSLARGGVYSWQVVALKDGKEVIAPAPPAPEAKFKVLDRASESELQRAEQAGGTSHLVRGIAYAKAGLLVDSEREFQALLKANPQSEIARKLLNRVRALRRSAD